MGKPHGIELRRRVVAFVEEGNTHRATAAHFRVSIKFVNEMVKLKRTTGSLAPKKQGNGGGHGKLTVVHEWITNRLEKKADITLDELVAELDKTHEIKVHRVSVWRYIRGLGLSHKKKISEPANKSGQTLRACAISGLQGANPI